MLSGEDPITDGDRGRRRQPSGALHERDVVRLHQTLQTLVEPPDDTVLVSVDPGHLDRLQRGVHTELGALACTVGDLRCVQQGLGRDTAAVQAGAADLVLLDQRHPHTELGGTERARVTTTAAAEDHEVEVVSASADMYAPW